jgi:hypothetical protein
MQGGLDVDFQTNLRAAVRWRIACCWVTPTDISITPQRFSPRLKADTERAISNTHALVGAGERMLDHALTHIYQMLENLMRHYGNGLP